MIPIDLIKYSITNGCVNELMTYCFLKSICDGHVYSLVDFIPSFKERTCLTERTFYNHKKWLIDSGWIKPMKKVFRIIGFKPLLEKLEIKNPKEVGAVFEGDFIHFTNFIYAAIITYVAKGKRFYLNRTGTKKGGTSKRLIKSLHVPHAYLAKVLGVSKSTAQHFRRYSEFYIDYEEYIQPLDTISIDEVKFCREEGFNYLSNVVIRGNNVWEQKPNLLYSSIIVKRCRL